MGVEDGGECSLKKKITKGDLHIEELFLKQKIYPDGRIMG